ncbi:hypothetical protein [Spirosoma radiotolerans]|uniref:Uncharacterized protein n=1 Tax=Spirosoma radiotolerans TaxID=1379870 RepID=A0A0E3ZY65_9BACT|nr:hypothetical protein [Spirosoma radiotolerans]AKD56640.1 hypothetical protein SD10_18790 [Spirosoma radiotolerans]
MNFLKVFALIGGLIFCNAVNAQWRLLQKSQDILIEPDTTNKIELIVSRGSFSKYLIVSYFNGEKKLVLKKEIWGYVDDKKEIWRSYKKEFYRVIKYNGGWVEYAVDRSIQSSRLRSYGVYSLLLYSRTLDSSIHTNWSEAMSDIPSTYILRQ